MSTLVSTPCPHCGASVPHRNGEPPRFCGQCGTTINLLAPPAPAAPLTPVQAYDQAVHEEVTVARDLPDIAAYLEAHAAKEPPETLLQAGPFGSHGLAGPGMPAPVVPPREPPPNVVVPAAGRPFGAASAKTQMMAQTMNDPEAQERARQQRDAIFAGVAASSPHPRFDGASPLSRSVLAPQSWSPPAPAAANEASDPLQQLPRGAVDVARVVSVGPASMPTDAPPRHVASDAPPRSAAPATTPTDAPPRHPPTLALGAQAPDAGAQAPSPAVGRPPPALRTMFGMPATDLAPPPVATSGTPVAPRPIPPAQKTMMGVAIPGVAPRGPEAGAAPPASLAGAAPIDLRSKHSTMLGVAIPGIAPTGTNDPPPARPATVPLAQYPYGTTPQGNPAPPPHVPSQVQNTALGMMAAPVVAIVPRPKTLIDEPLPAAPFIPPKRGVPALAVVGIVAGLVLVLGGVGGYFALRNGGTLTAVPQLDEAGRESLKIGCDSCPDGTTVALGASSATVASGAAVLPLPAPLTIGDNDLAVKIDRPGAGRDEDVKVHVPVAYRVRADLATLGAKPPAITVRVEAVIGSDVKVDDQVVVLDATGRGTYAIDLSKETDGTGEAKTFERKIPFVITPKGGTAQTGQLTARTGILSLALDAPGAELFTDKTTAAVAGQTRPGATVTIDGQNVPVDATGRFGVRVELASVGEKTLEIVASAALQAPRIAKVKVVRVASLDAAAKDLEGESPLTFDAFGADPATKIGQKAVVEGEVVDARSAAGHTVLLVDTKRGCAKGATCLVRVVHGEEDKVARGDVVRAYGRVLGAVTASGKTVPQLEASLVLPLKATR